MRAGGCPQIARGGVARVHGGYTDLIRTRRSLGADLLSYMRVDPLEIEASQEPRLGRPLKAALEARDSCTRCVLDDGDAVDTEERKLEVVPVLTEHRTVPTQAAVEQLCLPADLVVLEEIGAVRRDVCLGSAVDATGPEAFRVSRVEHQVLHRFVSEIGERHGAVIGSTLCEVGARCELDDRRTEAVPHAGPAVVG